MRHIQRRLLTMEALTLAKAYETAQGMETAEQHASELQASSKPKMEVVQAVHSWKGTAGKHQTTKVSTSMSRTAPNPCHRCGKTNHPPDNCYYKTQRCHKCQQLGHISRMCKSKVRGTDFVWEEAAVEEDLGMASDADELLFNIKVIKPAQSRRGLTVEVVMEGKPLVMELDTGESVSIMS